MNNQAAEAAFKGYISSTQFIDMSWTAAPEEMKQAWGCAAQAAIDAQKEDGLHAKREKRQSLCNFYQKEMNQATLTPAEAAYRKYTETSCLSEDWDNLSASEENEWIGVADAAVDAFVAQAAEGLPNIGQIRNAAQVYIPNGNVELIRYLFANSYAAVVAERDALREQVAKSQDVVTLWQAQVAESIRQVEASDNLYRSMAKKLTELEEIIQTLVPGHPSKALLGDVCSHCGLSESVCFCNDEASEDMGAKS
jgi:hypothetical protein